MKYALVLRKILYEDTIYYQVIDKVIGELTFDDKIKVVEGNFLDQEISSLLNKRSRMVYLEINKDVYENISMDEFIFYKEVGNEIVSVSDPNEYNDVTLAFHDEYHDFRLIPNYKIEELVSYVKEDLKDKVIGQDKPIDKILKKIYENHMYFESDLSYEDIYKYKNNILLIGGIGSGKSSIVDSILNMLSPIPVLVYKLTGDKFQDITDIVKQLLILAGGNKYLAERGIVIFDGIESIGTFNQEGDLISYVGELEMIMKSQDVYLKSQDNKIMKFDYSFITNVCILDMQYDFSDAKYDDIYYSKIYGKRLSEIGFSLNMIDDLFNNEAIFMEEMTEDLACNILKNKKTSPLYKIKKMLEERGKIVHISNDFINTLVDYGLDFNLGFSGIIRTLKYLLESKDISLKEINFRGDDIFDLKIGTVNVFHDEAYDELINEEDDLEVIRPKSNKEKKVVNDGLNVSLNKRTINDLTIMDTVNLIKKSVKGQDDAIFYVVNAFFNHIFNRRRDYTKEELRELKENILLFGPTGVGKTAIVRALANIFSIPFVREIATRYSKVGFVGEDVDSMLVDLVEVSKGDLEKAENGILYIDEIDKIKVEKGNHSDDMSSGVQYNLLTLIEGDKRVIQSKIPGRASIEFDTSNLWVIGTGAFDGLDEFIRERIKKQKGLGKVGFGQESSKIKKLETPTDDDLHEYGLDRQFLGRFPNKVPLNNINLDTLYEIIDNPDGGVVTLVKKGYASDGIVVSMSDGFKKMLAKKALEKKQGARGIQSAFIPIKNIIDKNIANGDIEKVILDENCFDDPDQIKYIKKKIKK